MRVARRVAIAAVGALGALLATPALADERTPPAPATRGAAYLVAHVREGFTVPVRLRPGGRVVGQLRARTEFGSPQRLAVVRSRGSRWLAVTTPAVKNDVGWIAAGSGGLTLGRVRESIEIDLSRRELRVLRRGRVLRSMHVAIGRPGSPTPTGRFHVTDKLAGPDFGAAYGCCILALSGRQTKLPPGWNGGDRLAIHGTPRPELLGQAVSAGCVRAGHGDLRFLMRTVRLGTPVFIRT